MMATDLDPADAFWQAIDVFVESLAGRVHHRWDAWAQTHHDQQIHEIVGGLLARQATLASEFALNPPIWNAHLGHLILRSMVENCITLAWILKAPNERVQQYIAYGLGQENLLLEQAKADLRELGTDPDKDANILEWEQWLNSQRYTFLTEVNVGNWGPSVREMAQETGLLDLHRNDYTRWSSATHSMWHHVLRFNVQYCTNPLHGYHRVPLIARLSPEPVLLQHAAVYMDTAIRVFDEATRIDIDDLSAVEILELEFHKIRGLLEREADDEAVDD